MKIKFFTLNGVLRLFILFMLALLTLAPSPDECRPILDVALQSLTQLKQEIAKGPPNWKRNSAFENNICDVKQSDSDLIKQAVNDSYGGKTSKDFPWGELDRHVRMLSLNLSNASAQLENASGSGGKNCHSVEPGPNKPFKFGMSGCGFNHGTITKNANGTNKLTVSTRSYGGSELCKGVTSARSLIYNVNLEKKDALSRFDIGPQSCRRLKLITNPSSGAEQVNHSEVTYNKGRDADAMNPVTTGWSDVQKAISLLQTAKANGCF